MGLDKMGQAEKHAALLIRTTCLFHLCKNVRNLNDLVFRIDQPILAHTRFFVQMQFESSVDLFFILLNVKLPLTGTQYEEKWFVQQVLIVRCRRQAIEQNLFILLHVWSAVGH